MAFGITVDVDTEAFEEDVKRLSAEFPKAAAAAVNATADRVLEGLTLLIDETVDTPTPASRDAFAATKARRSRNPLARIYLKDDREYLQFLFEGGVHTEPGGILVPGSGAKLDRYGNFPDGYLEMIEANGGWWMQTRNGMEGLYVRNAYGGIEAIALRVNRVRYEAKADFPGAVEAIVADELPKQLAEAFEATFGK